MNSVEFHNVGKTQKNMTIENLNITIPTGYITGLIGPNGSGKTTALNILMGISLPDHGDVKVFGSQLDHDTRLKQHIGFVHDDLHMYEQFTIKQMKSFIAPLYKTWDEDLFRYYLKRFELPLRKKLKTFSKGMKMKCNLLFALAHDPEILIMDEPTSGLDPIFRRELLKHLHSLMLESERTIVLSSHITSDLDRLADYVIFLDRGTVKLQKGMDTINETFYVVKGASEMIDADMKHLFSGVDMTDVGFSALFEGDPTLFSDFGDEVLVEKATLEDIMYFLAKNDFHGGMHYDAARQA